MALVSPVSEWTSYNDTISPSVSREGVTPISDFFIQDHLFSFGTAVTQSRTSLEPWSGIAEVKQVPPFESNKFQRSFRKVLDLRKLRPGWAGDGSVPPSLKTVADTITLLTMLPGEVEPPSITPSSDGEIVLEWVFGEKEAVVSLEGDGEFGYTLFVDDCFIPGDHDGLLTAGNLPRDLIDYLHSMKE